MKQGLKRPRNAGRAQCLHRRPETAVTLQPTRTRTRPGAASTSPTVHATPARPRHARVDGRRSGQRRSRAGRTLHSGKCLASALLALPLAATLLGAWAYMV